MIAWAIETFVATSLLMLLVLAIRKPTARAFGPNIAYALWLLPVIRMVIPPLPGNWQLSRLSAPFVRGAEEAPGVVGGLLNADRLPPDIAQNAILNAQIALAEHQANLALVPPTVSADGPSLIVLLIGLWVIGALAFLTYHLIAHSRFCAKLLKAARIDRTVAEGKVRVIETDAAHGPLAFGIWRKYVAFPRDFSERYDEQERDLALAHELGHHVRGDLIANWVALIVLALHWFNPIAWKAFRAFRADQEMACDALVLAGRAQALRHAYGRAIVKSAHGGAVSAACHLHTINELKGRLRMLSKTRNYSPARIASGLAGIGAISLVALGLTASGSQAAERITHKVEKTLGVTLSPQTAPEAPEAPEPPEAPAAPDAPDAPKVVKRVYTYTTTGDGDHKDHKGKHKVIVMSNGEKFEMPDMAEIEKSIPEIKEANCKSGEGDGQNMTVIKPKSADGKQRIVICTNRIEKLAMVSAEMGQKHKKLGLQSALMGLKHARASIEMQGSLSGEQKTAALNGIDEAIAEIEKEARED